MLAVTCGSLQSEKARDMGLQEQQIEMERRQHLYLREIFEDAYRLSLPFIDPALGYRGVSLGHQAYVALHEAYPDLTQSQLAVLVPALERVFRERQRAQ